MRRFISAIDDASNYYRRSEACPAGNTPQWMQKMIHSIYFSVSIIFLLPMAQLSIAEVINHPVSSSHIVNNCHYTQGCVDPPNQHTGIDYGQASGTSIFAAAFGTITNITINGSGDHGLGNTIIIEHNLASGGVVYSLYAHLNSITSGLTIGNTVVQGQQIGVMGGSGYGSPDHWGVHLHFEIKDASVLDNPSGSGIYYGYTPSHPDNYGYHDPEAYIGVVEVIGGEYALTWNAQGIENWSSGYNPIVVSPGQIIDDLWISYHNDGSAIWTNSPSGDSWIALTACCFDHPDIDCICGTYPCNRDSVFAYNWEDGQFRACYPDETSISFDEYATFHFSVQAPAQPGDYHEFFHPFHFNGHWVEQPQGGYPQAQFFFRVVEDLIPNLSFENDDSPADGIPDGWIVQTWSGATFTHVEGDAAHGTRSARFTHSQTNQSSAIGLPAAAYIEPNTFYRVHFWYKTNVGSTDVFGWRMASADLQSSLEVMGGGMQNPLADGNWHRYWSAPFQVTPTQLNNYPYAAFYFPSGNTGAVTIDWISFLQLDPCP